MNTNTLKKFAQGARRKLREQVGARLDFVLNTDTAELREKAAALQKLRNALQAQGRDALTERVAYTWFNRLAALRFMDANGYQPLGLRVLSPREGFTLPELLDEAKRGHIPEGLKVDAARIFGLLDGRLPAANPQNEAYRYLLTAACNHLHHAFPFLFERLDDYTELLLPDDLASEFSIIHDVREGMAEEDCHEVEVLGWLYQFYISEKKDEVFASKSKVKQEDIPAATQLFTPRWIVEYLVQNTLGRLWLQARPNSRLREHMLYYVAPAPLNPPEGGRLPDGASPHGANGGPTAEQSPPLAGAGGWTNNESTNNEPHEPEHRIPNTEHRIPPSPESLRLLDPACGSGHILVYAFELLARIYEEEGYNPADIPALILEHNLHGFEIDERAAQLAALALLLKARQYHRRAFRKAAKPNILCFRDLSLPEAETKSTLEAAGIFLSPKLLHDLEQMRQATNFGALIRPQTARAELERNLEKLQSLAASGDLFLQPPARQLTTTHQQLLTLSRPFHLVVANPPYMGSGNMNKALSDFVKREYPEAKADLLTCFMERSHSWLEDNGLMAMINLPSWMFLSSFEKFRKNFLQQFQVESLLHLGRGIFGSDFGTVAFAVRKTDAPKGKGVYRRLFKEHVQVRSVEKIRKLFLDKNYGYHIANQQDFAKIPGSPVGYWVSQGFIETFEKGTLLEIVNDPKKGLATTDNNRFLRFWFEVENRKFGIGVKTREEAERSKRKWFPLNKGGEFRKWYGNKEYVINWLNDGSEIKDAVVKRYGGGSYTKEIRSEEKYFKDGITWSALTSSISSFRFTDYGALFDSAGSTMAPVDNPFILLGLLNSPVVKSILLVLNPTLNFGAGTIAKIPIYFPKNVDKISKKVEDALHISKMEWNDDEISWDFRVDELIRLKNDNNGLESTYHRYRKSWQTHFLHLHQNEEHLNRQFIHLYGLEDELTPDVPLEDITILQEELDRKALAKLNKQLKRDPETGLVVNYEAIELPFDAGEVMRQLVSYSVGCLFGRYSLDKEGLILANQGETLEDYLWKVGRRKAEGGKEGDKAFVTFMPDEDNVVPILDDEWFEDDIVGRFYEFLRAAFGAEHFDKNLAFVEECLGKDVRSYFVKDFYNDHIRRYRKRPIYWLFSSPGGAFNALIYLHRYTPDTLSTILNKYLREFRGKLRSRREQMEHQEAVGAAAEKARAAKEMERLDKMLLDLQQYERDILFPLAAERIQLDLDDGVLVNYNKLGRAVKEVSGLNDKNTKGKVRGFDWVDAGEVRG